MIYEPRLESETLLLSDFDLAVHRIVAQPFMFRAEIDGKIRRHIPDYLLDTDDGPVVVDVVRRERLGNPRIVQLCFWTRELVESLGWSYVVASEAATALMANVRILAGYCVSSSDLAPGMARSVTRIAAHTCDAQQIPRFWDVVDHDPNGGRSHPLPAARNVIDNNVTRLSQMPNGR